MNDHQDWLIEDAMTATAMRVMWIVVTPERAADWLRENTQNRSLRASAVARYAADMKDGRWTPSDSMICFNTEGKLYNGQHRLTAVVNAQVPVGFWVAFNMPAEAYANMDRGVGRTYADTLRHKGEEGNTTQLSAALSKACGFADSMQSPEWTLLPTGVTDAQRGAYLLANPGIRRSVAKYANAAASRRTGGANRSILALAHHLIERSAGPDAAEEFMLELTTLGESVPGSTIAAAIRALSIISNQRRLEKQLAIILAAWNHWATGTEVGRILIPADFRTRRPRIATRVTR